jgi:hypothetical protein
MSALSIIGASYILEDESYQDALGWKDKDR